MADIDPNAIPFVPDTSVTLIDKGSGKQTTALHDWLSGLYDWMKRSVVDLTTKVTTLIDQTGDNTATIEEHSQALTDGSGAYGTYITSINTKANNATASGQIFLASKATPTGATAAYGVYLTAGSAFTGFEMIAKTGGGSAIGMSANQLTFTDSGTAQQVFSYSSGVFTFAVPVRIASTTGAGSLDLNNQNIKIYDPIRLRVAIGVNI